MGEKYSRTHLSSIKEAAWYVRDLSGAIAAKLKKIRVQLNMLHARHAELKVR